MTKQPDQTKPAESHDPLLAITYWSNLVLSVIAFFLAGFYLLILLNAASGTIPMNTLVGFAPFWYTLLTWLYLGALTREYRDPADQHGLPWLILLSLAGCISLGALAFNVMQDKTGSSAIVLLPLMIGGLSFATVLRIVFAEFRARDS